MNIADPCFSISGVARAQDSTIKSDSDFVKTPIVIATFFSYAMLKDQRLYHK